MTRFVFGVLVGLALGIITSSYAAVLQGAGILLDWTVTGDGKSPGEPRVRICYEPTVQPIDKVIECHQRAMRP
jgi:hypothetical protein